MSYILDALRKADAERERGSVPGIHAQPIFAGAAQAGQQRIAQPWLRVGVTAAAVLLVAALLWYLIGGGASRGAAEPALSAQVATLPATVPAPIAVAPARVAAPTEVARPAPEPARVVRKPAAPIASKQVVAKPAIEAPAPTTASDSRVHALNELPDDIRRQLPTLTVGGSMYSTIPANRILIINGQVLHEGAAIAPDLVLQQIKLKAAVLAYKGYRYGITF